MSCKVSSIFWFTVFTVYTTTYGCGRMSCKASPILWFTVFTVYTTTYGCDVDRAKCLVRLVPYSGSDMPSRVYVLCLYTLDTIMVYFLHHCDNCTFTVCQKSRVKIPIQGKMLTALHNILSTGMDQTLL